MNTSTEMHDVFYDLTSAEIIMTIKTGYAYLFLHGYTIPTEYTLEEILMLQKCRYVWFLYTEI